MDNSKTSKYLTEMKELPPETTFDGEDSKPEKSANPSSEKTVSVEKGKKQKDIGKPKKTEKALVDKKDENLDAVDEDMTEVEETEKSFTGKDIVLGIINFLCIVAIVFLIAKFPTKSQELKSERTQAFLDDVGFSYELSEISSGKDKADEIESRFVNDSGVVDFVNELEKIKADSGLINKISFPSQKAVEDKATGQYGIPVRIEFRGNLDLIIDDINKIQNLPFIVRTITIDSARDAEDPSVVNLKYGGFIYVDS